MANQEACSAGEQNKNMWQTVIICKWKLQMHDNKEQQDYKEWNSTRMRLFLNVEDTILPCKQSLDLN